METIVTQDATNALTAAYNRKIRPLLDAVHRLRHLNVIQEDIKVPTIVVVGDQSSGKSSVLESLTGISLPRGEGICTRVPLIMRLQDDPSLPIPEFLLEYLDKKVPASEKTIAEAIDSATDEIAGKGKGVCSIPLTLLVKKRGLPDLTMVDLPAIIRVPGPGQPEDIYEQTSKIVMEYISPQESVILNVLSASVDFPTCESTRISQQVDVNCERTLAVVAKTDKSPQGLLEKVTGHAVNVGLGYVCIRNGVGRETYEQARAEELKLFQNNPHLSNIDKSTVGIPALAQKLMQIQVASISKSLPYIVRKISEKFDLVSLPRNLSSFGHDIKLFTQMISSSKDKLRGLIIRSEYGDKNNDDAVHGRVRVTDLLLKFAKEMPINCPVLDDHFLMDEIRVLEEVPNSLRNAFQTLLERKIKLVSDKPFQFVSDVWLFIEGVVLTVLLEHSDDYPQLQSSIRKAVISVMEKKKEKSIVVVEETIEKEMTVDYTSNPDYMKTWYELMEQQENFMNIIHNQDEEAKINLDRFGLVEVGHLRKYSALVEQAYDMRMRLTAYWKIVMMRMVDEFALHILHSLKMLVEEELEAALVSEVVGVGMTDVEETLKELPITAEKRSLDLPKESDITVNIHNEFGTIMIDTQAKEDTLKVGRGKHIKQQPIERPKRVRKPPTWLKDFIH